MRVVSAACSRGAVQLHASHSAPQISQNVFGSTNCKAAFSVLEIKESQTDTTSVQAGHAGAHYASEVSGSAAERERANEGIKKKEKKKRI